MKKNPSTSSAENIEVKEFPFSDPDTDNKFSSTLSTYLTLLGYSVGIADIWRFPFLAYRNGGGAFLLPFVTMILVCGIPMYFLEYSVSKFSGRGAYQLWDICPLFRGVGLTVGLAYGLYMTGSSIFRCWSIEFLLYAFQDPIPWSHCDNPWNSRGCRDNNLLINAIAKPEMTSNDSTENENASYHGHSMASLNGSLSLPGVNMTLTNRNISLSTPENLTQMSAAEEFWQYKILQLSSGIDDLTPIIWKYFLYMFIYRLIILLGSIKSIKSIEKVIYVTATVPFFLTVAIFVRSLMLPGSTEGLKYFFLPDFEKISRARVWIEATLMAFYTLAFGWGANLLLGSHAAFKENCLRTAVLLPVIDMLMAVFSGMVCFSVLGNMAHAYEVHIENVISAGMSTGMVAYITALASLPFPQIWSGFFLISTILTGIDSQLIPLDMIIQLFGDLFPRFKFGSRVYVLCAVSVIIMLLSLTTCTGGGAFLFLWNDWYSGAWIGPIVAFIEVTVVAWIYGAVVQWWHTRIERSRVRTPFKALLISMC
ncbi:hypothetical protein ACF0H5_016812 [Mactra antiquata]